MKKNKRKDGDDDDKKPVKNNDRDNPTEPGDIGAPDRATESVIGSLNEDIDSQLL